MAHLARIWECDWSFAGTDERTVRLRARGWWVEDAADVPDAQLQPLRDSLGRGKAPALKMLLELAELSKPQVHKLVESGVCGDATGLVEPGWYDETGAKPCLQFFSRLPAGLQARARGPLGLPLAEAPRQLVRTWLSRTLICNGELDDARWGDLIFRVDVRREDDSHPGVTVSLQFPGVKATWDIAPRLREA